MGPLIWLADASGRDVCAVSDLDLDAEDGIGEDAPCDFELTLARDASGRRVVPEGGWLWYMEGTPAGGVVDSVTSPGDGTVTCRGRTWAGVLARKVIDPGDGHVAVSGEGNAVIARVLSLCALPGLMAASTAQSAVRVPATELDRFCTAWDGLWEALRAAGARLEMGRLQGGPVVLSAVPSRTLEARGEDASLSVTLAHRVVNHLVCAGEGQGGERVRADLYADEAGRVSEAQSLFGVDELAEYYGYSSADRERLVADGTRRLRGYQTRGEAEVTLSPGGPWALGDRVRASDPVTGATVEATVSGRVTKVAGGAASVAWTATDARVRR
ncbi:hypothetical protein [Olsenella uli]|uniref:hypothetical protein n=1 Tax=Olsenella uli TaxID=133926 RepID=UPI0028EE5714|nr:hypothetical protein [Olsenella uli]